MNLARLCARLKPVFLSKKGPSKARLLTKMSSSEELGTLCMCITHCVCVCVPVYVEGLFGLDLGQGWSRVHKAKTER